MTVATLSIEFDVRELRALHFSTWMLDGALKQLSEEDGLNVGLPDDRTVRPADSALMKIETALVAAGVEL